MMKSQTRIILLVAVLCGVAWMGRSFAQNTVTVQPATRVAVCDVVQVFNNYTKAKDLTAKLNARRDEIKAENDSRVKSIENMAMEIEGLREGSPEYETRMNEIQRLSIERQAWIQFQQQLTMRDHHRLTREMYDEILVMIRNVSQENGIEIVLYHMNEDIASEDTEQLLQQIQARKVLYASPQSDLTETVLARLNRAYDSGR